MSTASMGQAPAQSHLHFYSNHKQQCTFLLPDAQPFINTLPHQAMNTQIHGGNVMQNLSRKIFEVKENWMISVDLICQYKTLTFFFSNTGSRTMITWLLRIKHWCNNMLMSLHTTFSRITCLVSRIYSLDISWSFLFQQLVVGCKWMSPVITGITYNTSFFWILVLLWLVI